MPVVAAIKCGCEFTRRRNLGVAVKHMTDLVRIFLLDARQRQLRESLCGMRIELWSNVVSRDADQWNQQESEQKSLHPAGFYVWGAQAASLYVSAASRNSTAATTAGCRTFGILT